MMRLLYYNLKLTPVDLTLQIFPSIIQPNTDAKDPMKDLVKETSSAWIFLTRLTILMNNKDW
jgi:hypothetical protein